MFEGFYRQPPAYENIRRGAEALSNQFPFLQMFTIGESLLGRKLYAFALGSPRHCSLFVGTVHGTEWLTGLLLMRFLKDICLSLQKNQTLADIDMSRSLETRSLVIIPFLNPDGLELSLHGVTSAGYLKDYVQKISGGDTCHWQANARGIDLNHNFNAGFDILQNLERKAGIMEPGPTRFGGLAPHSEPESYALVHFCEQFLPEQAYAFHSQGEEIYYQYGAHTPCRSRLMAQVLSSASGYRLSEPEGTASHGGFKDWFIEYYRKPAFTIEIGRGKNPLPIEELEPIYARLLEMLLISILL